MAASSEFILATRKKIKEPKRRVKVYRPETKRWVYMCLNEPSCQMKNIENYSRVKVYRPETQKWVNSKIETPKICNLSIPNNDSTCTPASGTVTSNTTSPNACTSANRTVTCNTTNLITCAPAGETVSSTTTSFQDLAVPTEDESCTEKKFQCCSVGRSKNCGPAAVSRVQRSGEAHRSSLLHRPEIWNRMERKLAMLKAESERNLELSKNHQKALEMSLSTLMEQCAAELSAERFSACTCKQELADTATTPELADTTTTPELADTTTTGAINTDTAAVATDTTRTITDKESACHNAELMEEIMTRLKREEEAKNSIRKPVPVMVKLEPVGFDNGLPTRKNAHSLDYSDEEIPMCTSDVNESESESEKHSHEEALVKKRKLNGIVIVQESNDLLQQQEASSLEKAHKDSRGNSRGNDGAKPSRSSSILYRRKTAYSQFSKNCKQLPEEDKAHFFRRIASEYRNLTSEEKQKLEVGDEAWLAALSNCQSERRKWLRKVFSFNKQSCQIAKKLNAEYYFRLRIDGIEYVVSSGGSGIQKNVVKNVRIPDENLKERNALVAQVQDLFNAKYSALVGKSDAKFPYSQHFSQPVATILGMPPGIHFKRPYSYGIPALRQILSAKDNICVESCQQQKNIPCTAPQSQNTRADRKERKQLVSQVGRIFNDAYAQAVGKATPFPYKRHIDGNPDVDVLGLPNGC